MGLAAFGRAGDWGRLDRSIQGLSVSKAAHVIKGSELYKGSNDLTVLSAEDLVSSVHLLAEAETAETGGAQKDTKSLVKEIKRQQGIVDGRTADKANWLANALERLKNLNLKPPEVNAPKADPSVLSKVGVFLMWGLLGVGVTIFLVFALLHLSKLQKRAVVRALVEDDEPERSVDEWLGLANQLEGEGRFREAVRALYLACLIRLDEAGVARFLKYETNWEHQHRIQASPKRPAGLDMLPATRMMDRVWYGYRTEGAPDVATMREVYEQVMREAFAA
ncbi:hypothetical protein BH11ARM2_BH11ARM2_30590 [soil metagenome]